jgi:hypothetical protein
MDPTTSYYLGIALLFPLTAAVAVIAVALLTQDQRMFLPRNRRPRP